jgi:hypothetical protein
MWLAHIFDTILFLQKSRSIADLPLYVRFENAIKNPDYYDYYRRGFRQTSQNLISPCAYIETFEDAIEITLRFPRLVCQYLPHRKCPFDDVKATVLLLNHEIIHAVFMSWDSIEGELLNIKWDSITRLMNQILPETYCEC